MLRFATLRYEDQVVNWARISEQLFLVLIYTRDETQMPMRCQETRKREDPVPMPPIVALFDGGAAQGLVHAGRYRQYHRLQTGRPTLNPFSSMYIRTGDYTSEERAQLALVTVPQPRAWPLVCQSCPKMLVVVVSIYTQLILINVVQMISEPKPGKDTDTRNGYWTKH